MFSTKPFNTLMELINAFPDEQSCIDHLEKLRWNGNVISPYDPDSEVYKCKNNQYKCRNTNKYFNVRTDTIFEGSKISLKNWFLAIYLFTVHKKGISSYQLATDIGVTQKTAWFMLQRIRYAMEHTIFVEYMEGIIECDETFVGGKNKNRHKDKKVQNSQGRSFKDKTPVLGMIERGGKVKCKVVPDTKANSIQPIIRETVREGSIIYSDEWWGYRGLSDKYYHGYVDHGKGQYQNGDICTNTIEGFWSHFKRSMVTYNHVSRKHMQKYAEEMTFRYNFRQENPNQKFNLFLQSSNGKRLTYNQLIK